MPTISYSIKSSKNNNLPISASELEGLFFFGIPIKDQSGNVMSSSDIEFNIRKATEEIEGYLNIKVTRQVISETLDYSLNDYRQWGYIPCSFPVACAISLKGMYGTLEQVNYPSNWLTSKKSSDGISYNRDVSLVPTSDVVTGSGSAVYSGITTGHLSSFSNVPNFWTFKYVSSFDRMPEDILMVIGKLATINIFAQLGDIILGAGIASQSLGIDGLSQSVSTTSSATSSGYGSRMVNYYKDLKQEMPLLKSKYDGLNIVSC